MRKLIRFFLNTIPRKHLIRLSYLFRKVTAVYYKGSRYTCPVCEKSFRSFLPYGYAIIRENVLCPNCLSLERHRLLWLYLKNKTDFFTAEHKVLHVAPEQCFEERFRKMKNLDYITADLESPLADVKLDLQEMPFENNTFDIVVCNHVLEHVEDLYRAISEIIRVLKVGGYAILQVPFDANLKVTYEDPSITSPKEREKHFLQYDHLRLFGMDYPQILKKAGFVIEEGNYVHEVSQEEKEKLRLPDHEFMYSFKKPPKKQ